VKDFRVVSTLDDSYTNGIFKLAVDIRNNAATDKNLQVLYELIDKASGKVVANATESCIVKGEDIQTDIGCKFIWGKDLDVREP